MTDEHASHMGFADTVRAKLTPFEQERAAAARGAAMSDHLEHLSDKVGRLNRLRLRITEIEKADAQHIMCATGADLGRSLSIEVPVAKADVLDQARLTAEQLQREATQHLNAIAAFIEGK